MKVTIDQAKREDWDKVKSWNYQLPHLSPKRSVVYAELEGVHGEVESGELERVYYIMEGEGEGEFVINGESILIKAGEVITVPPNTKYDYKPMNNSDLKIVLFMEIWEN